MRKTVSPTEIVIQTLCAAAFLSRLPLLRAMNASGMNVPAPDFAFMARYFAPAGIIVALPAGIAVVILGYTGIGNLLLAVLAIAILALSTGALHEDGLADVADGFGGGTTVEKKLEIMRDSRIGTYGAVALVLSLLMRASAVATLLETDRGWRFALAFLAISALSRGSMAWLWANLKPARSGAGLSRDNGMPEKSDALFALSLGAIIGAAFLMPMFGTVATAAIMAVGGTAVIAWRRICERQIGGHTGDILGAGQQISEIALLLAAAIAI